MITNFLLGFIAGMLLLIFAFTVKAWQKISIFLTWNTRYTGADYEKAVTTAKITAPPVPPSKTEKKGRSITPVEDLVDISDLPFDTAYEAIVGEDE